MSYSEMINKSSQKVRIEDLINGTQLKRRMTVKTNPGVDLNVALTPDGGIEIKASFRYIASGEYRPELLANLKEPLIDFLNREAKTVIDFCLASAKEEIDAIAKRSEGKES